MAGCTCANDVSAREYRFGEGRWFRGNGHDAHRPVSPLLLQIDDAADVRVVPRLNGRCVQDSPRSSPISDIPASVEYITRVVTRLPSGLSLTGTPDAVGGFRYPKRGDVVEVDVERTRVVRNTAGVA